MNEPQNKYAAFIDLLGFTNQLVNPIGGDVATMKNVIDYYHELMGKSLGTLRARTGISQIAAQFSDCAFPEISFTAMSDSIIITTDNLYDILGMVAGVQKFVLHKGMAVRGGLAKGLHWEESGEGKLLMVSPAFVVAHDLESKFAHNARVIICKCSLWDIQFSNSVYVRGKIGMLVQCEDDYFAINSMMHYADTLGTVNDQDFTIENIRRGMENCNDDIQKRKWAWLADLYNFEALRLHGNMDDEEWRQYYINPDSIPVLLAKHLHKGSYFDYADLIQAIPSRFIDIKDLTQKASVKNMACSLLGRNSFEENMRILIG